MANKTNKEAVADYATKMKDIKLRVPYTPGKFDENGKPVSDHYNVIKAAADSHKMSVNEYILYLVSKDTGIELTVGVKGKAITSGKEE